MFTLKKITASLIWGGYFIVKHIGFLHNMLPLQYFVTGPRLVNKRWMIFQNSSKTPFIIRLIIQVRLKKRPS